MSPEIMNKSFSSLSIKDLLEAREAYHVHLITFDTVFATALGRFRMLSEDPCTRDPYQRSAYGVSSPRTLANSVVTPWSWPCVLVFVDDWYDSNKVKKDPHQAIPRLLYLPDGRIVPTCVILAHPPENRSSQIEHLSFPSETIGGGYSCFVRSQGQEQNGTIGVLVTREGNTFALTNRHVTGRTGQEVYAFVKGTPERIGVSDSIHLGKKVFEEVYLGWPGKQTIVNIDAGLIHIDDLTDWTSQVFGIGEVGPIKDMNVHTISLDLIGSPVRAFGSVSGPCEGEIQGLFYRYCSKGGFDYVADLLIGPRTEILRNKPTKDADKGKERPRLNVHLGDSGTIVFLDPPKIPRHKDDPKPDRAERARRLRPIAMLWGGVVGGD